MFFSRCYSLWSLILSFLAGLLLMLAFWLTLAKIALSDWYSARRERLEERGISLGNRDNGGAPDA